MNADRSFLQKIFASIIVTPVVTLLMGEAFTHLFNVRLDAALQSRLLFTFQKPLIFVLVVVMEALLLIAVYRMLTPLLKFLKHPDHDDTVLYEKARRAALGLPWVLIITTVVFWTVGTIVFYALNGWKSPGGTPLAWVLSFKISTAVLSATLNALFINHILIGPKQALRIEYIREGEVDWFNRSRDLITVLATMTAMIAHQAYIARYFILRDPRFRGPVNPLLSQLAVGCVIGLVSLAMVVLTRREDSMQTALLRSRITQLTSPEAADLTAQATIVNFNAIGELTDGFNRYSSTLRSMVQGINTAMASLSGTNGALSGGSDKLKQAVQEMNQSIGDIGTLVGEEVEAAADADINIERISANIGALHNSINEQAAMVTESSAGIEQMIANIKSVSANIGQVQGFYTKLQDAAGNGRRKVNEANALIQKVSEMSGLLAEANKVIAAIASQTNLLAMNAAIEAAHAGSAGAGFSVVADEIRNLAEKSALQSKDVKKHLKGVVSSIDMAVTASAEAEQGFAEVSDLIDTVTRYEDEIRNAMREQSEGSRQIMEALTAMNGVTADVNTGAAEMSGRAREIVGSMQRLNELSQRMSIEMETIDQDSRTIRETFQEILIMIESNSHSIAAVNAQVQRFKV